MLVPFVLFWVLLFFGRDELGLKGILVAVSIWAALLVGTALLAALAGISPYLFVAAQALLDVVLILMIFGGDLRIR